VLWPDRESDHSPPSCQRDLFPRNNTSP
jgi:hypothetical protein